jgi:hypothetical protein
MPIQCSTSIFVLKYPTSPIPKVIANSEVINLKKIMKKTIYSLLLLCSIMSSVSAQQKENNNKQETVNAKLADFSINKSSTDVEIKRITEILEKQYEIQLKTSKIKRNLNNEITAIKIDYKYKDGNEVSIVKKEMSQLMKYLLIKKRELLCFIQKLPIRRVQL